MSDVQTNLPYLCAERNRHGNPRLYVRIDGKRIQIKEQLGTPAFANEYAKAVETLRSKRLTPKPNDGIEHNTFAWLAHRYFGSTEFLKLDAKSRRTRQSIIESCMAEHLNSDRTDKIGSVPVAHLKPMHVKFLRDKKAGLPGAANNRLKYLSSMFAWAIEENKMSQANPARDVKPFRYASDGFHTWSVDEIAQFETRWTIGTKPRLAMALMRYLGVRRGDMVKLGPANLRDGVVTYVPSKTSYLRMEAVHKPVLPPLGEVLAQVTSGETWLRTDNGAPFTAAGFGNWFRDQCDAAGLPQCTAHGLRKAAAKMAAEQGASERQMMAIFDWKSPSQASVYTKRAEQKKLARDSMKLIAGGKR